MPMERRLHVVETRIEERFGIRPACTELTYDQLDPSFVADLLTELGERGADFPIVLVGDAVACASGVDIDAILAFIGASRTAEH